MQTAQKCSCISRPPGRNEGEELPESVANITLKYNGKLSNAGVWWRKETSAKAVTVQGAVVALEINMQKCRTATVVLGKSGNQVFFCRVS